MTFVLIAFQLVLLLVILRLRRSPAVSPLLSTSLLFLAVVWYVTPVLLTIMFWDTLSYRSVVGYDAFVSYASLETLMLLLASTFLLRKAPYFRLVTNSVVGRLDASPGLALLIVVLAIAVASSLMFGLRGTTYYEQNAFSVTAQGTSAFNEFGSLQFLSVMLTCFLYACLLTRWPRVSTSRLLYVIALSWVVIVTVVGLLTGARVGLMTPFILLALYGHMRQWPLRKIMLAVAAPALITVTFGSVLVLVIAQSRGMSELSLESTVAKSVQLAKDEGLAATVWESLDQLVTKFDSFTTGAYLVRREGIGVAGWSPYYGSAFAVVPRTLLPSKPVPGSADGTYVGHPGRIVAERLGMDPASGNVNVSPAAVTIWQLGFLNLIPLVLFNALHLQLINSLALSRSIFLRSLALFLIGVPTLLTLFATPDTLIMNVERVGLVYGGLFLVAKIVQLRYQKAGDPAEIHKGALVSTQAIGLLSKAHE